MVWVAVDRVGTGLLQFVNNLVLARLLMPEDFGCIGMLAIFMAVSQVFIDAGFGSALIQDQNVTQEDYSNIKYKRDKTYNLKKIAPVSMIIDPKLQAQLREKYNPDGSLLRSHQLRMLEVLKYVDSICRENNINYWLSSGTCLGAVRHGGFIPWDDDADIEMLREDYLKLEKILEKETQYDFQTWRTDPYYMQPFVRLRDKKSKINEYGLDVNYKYRGVYIDIFLLERVPSLIGKIYGGVKYRLLMMGSSKSRLKKIIFRILKNIFYLSIFISRPLLKPFTNPNILRHTYGSGFAKKVRIKEQLLPLKDIMFENHMFKVPYNTDLYLTNLYGNYRELPDLSLISKHTTDVELYS